MARTRTMHRFRREVEMGGQRVSVDFDLDGVPIGLNGTRLQSYIRVIARHKIPISFHSWLLVDELYKEKLWDSIKSLFIIDERHKKMVLSSAADKWRYFKYMLAKTYIRPFLDEPEHYAFPPQVYNFIEQKDWDEFVASRVNV